MLHSSVEIELDQIDIDILRELQADGRVTNADLARRINLSPPATHARVKRLENQHLIHGYTALLDSRLMGFDMVCFVNVSLQTHQFERIEHFRRVVRDMPQVLECHHVTGEFDYLMKVVIRNRDDLERFVVQKLTPLEGVSRIYTSLVLSEVKSTTALPLPHNP